MNIYDNDASKIYPDLNPTASQSPQTYCSKKVIEIEAYLLDEIEVRERFRERCVINTGVIISAVITGGGVPIAAFAGSAGLLFWITFSGTSFFSCNSNYKKIL